MSIENAGRSEHPGPSEDIRQIIAPWCAQTGGRARIDPAQHAPREESTILGLTRARLFGTRGGDLYQHRILEKPQERNALTDAFANLAPFGRADRFDESLPIRA